MSDMNGLGLRELEAELVLVLTIHLVEDGNVDVAVGDLAQGDDGGFVVLFCHVRILSASGELTRPLGSDHDEFEAVLDPLEAILDGNTCHRSLRGARVREANGPGLVEASRALYGGDPVAVHPSSVIEEIGQHVGTGLARSSPPCAFCSEDREQVVGGGVEVVVDDQVVELDVM